FSNSFGSFKVDMDNGKYTYSYPVGFVAGQHTYINFAVSDSDNDRASAVLDLTGNSKTLYDDRVLTSQTSVVIGAYALLYNDVDPNNIAGVTLSSGSNVNGT